MVSFPESGGGMDWECGLPGYVLFLTVAPAIPASL